MTEIHKLINKVKLEDNATYLEILEKIDGAPSSYWNTSDIFKTIDNKKVDALSISQLELLKTLHFKGGYKLHFSTYGNNPLYISKKMQTINSSYINNSALDNITKEDLIYISKYHRTKWKKANPSSSTRATRGTGFVFKMDMFSLTIFKKAITKKFLRTEAKNLIMSVNKAFKESSKESSAIKVRNKYYHVILNNTEYLTKAALNELMVTNLKEGLAYYNASEDEAIAIEMRYSTGLMAFTPSECMDTWSSDTAIVTHNLGYESERENQRMLGAVSALTTAYANTNNEAYLKLATRTAQYLPKEMRQATLNATQSVMEMRNILKHNDV